MISVIVPTRNRASFVSAMLDSLCRQTLDSSKFEVIVVDNGSSDDTQNVIQQFRSQIPNLGELYAATPGLHTGRHTGLKAANGDVLVFADDDIEALPSWLAAIEEAFQDSSVVMVGGNNIPFFMEEPPAWIVNLWGRNKLQGYKAIPSLSIIEFSHVGRQISPYLVWGCNFAIRKSVLLQAGGFHPDGMPKELIRFRGDGESHVSRYVVESRMKCVFHPGASVYHKVTPERMTHAYFRQRGFAQGVSDSYTQLRQREYSVSAKRSFIGRALSYVLRGALGLADTAEVKRAFEELKLGHSEGYIYHQAAYRDDPEVREWVHRPNYY